MATQNTLRKGLNRKLWEMVAPAPNASAAGNCFISSRHLKNYQMYIAGTTIQYLYNPEEDGFIQIPSGALAGTHGAGTCGAAGSIGPTGTATAGSATTLTTNLTILRDLRGYKIHITGGPGAGDIVDIVSNTIGANSVITAAFSTTITNASTYRLITPRWYILNAGTIASGSFKVYCFALNTWTTLVNTGLPASWGTDGRMISTSSFTEGAFQNFASGTATAGAATTLTNSGKAWATNQWTSFQIRITAGTGLGQVRTISSNTGTVITVSASWTTNPDSTSQYVIEGCDDFLYLMGNNAITMYRYSISANTWSTLSPSVARAAAPTTGFNANWVWDINDSAWTTENSIRNGQRIYSFRGGTTVTLDYYDIAANAWVNAVSYAPATETFASGTKYAYTNGSIYIQKEATGRWFRYDVLTNSMEPWGTLLYTQGAAVLGDTSFLYTFVDGATEIHYIYFLLNTSTVMLRCMVI